MSDACSSCQVPFLEDDGPVECSMCACRYHFGKCAGIKKKSFNGKSEAAKSTWRCPPCRGAGQRANNSGDEEPELDVKSLLASINQKLDSLPLLREKVDSMELSVQFLSKQFDEFEKKIKHQEAEIKELRKRVTDLEEKEKMSRVVNGELQKEVNDLEFRSRRLNLEIHGIPVTENEDLITELNKVADKIEVPHLEVSDVVTVHRLPARKDHVPGIIIHFVRQDTKDIWLKKRSTLKDVTPRIFIQENLTRFNRELLRATKDMAKEKSYAFAWYGNGKVFVRKSAGMRAIPIKDRDDLDRL